MKILHHTNATIVIFFGLILALSSHAQTQVKMEKEVRIKENNVPEIAKTFLKEAGVVNRIKWYKDTDFQEVVIEAKAKHRGTLYSIEFDTTGHIINVEYIIKYKHLARKIKSNIENQLDTKFRRYTFIKTQKQYTGNKKALNELIRNDDTEKNFVTRYEIVLKGTEENYKRKYELTTDREGVLIDMKKIVEPDMDILIY